MKVHIYDFRWNNESSVEFQASLNGKFGKKELKIGDDFSVQICSDVYCAGNRVDDVWNPCAQGNKGKSKCEICKQMEQRENYIFTSFDGFNQEFLNAKDLEKIAGLHMVYFAFFDKDIIKVGVSKKERKNVRQLEQGSIGTLFIAETPDGIQARKIETLIRKNGIIDKVQSDKKELIPEKIAPEEMQKILVNEFEKQKKEWPREYTILEKNFLETPEFVSWRAKYNIDEIEKKAKPLHKIELQKDEWVSGKIMAIRGSFLIIETPTEFVAINGKDLQGLDGEFELREPGLKTNIALQNTLF